MRGDIQLPSGILITPRVTGEHSKVLGALIDHYVEQQTIEPERGKSLKEMVLSEDRENQELAKIILSNEYKILFL